VRILALLAVVCCLTGCGVFTPSFMREDAIEVNGREDNTTVLGVDGPTGGHFTDDGEWVPDNAEIPSTYKIPDIGAGFIVDLNSLDVTPSLQIELSRLNYLRLTLMCHT
jgi:hypothetical protein